LQAPKHGYRGPVSHSTRDTARVGKKQKGKVKPWAFNPLYCRVQFIKTEKRTLEKSTAGKAERGEKRMLPTVLLGCAGRLD